MIDDDRNVDPADVDDDDHGAIAGTINVETDCVTQLGLSAINIAELCRATWFKCAGIEQRDDQSATARWTEAVERMFAVCEGRYELSFRELAVLFQKTATGQDAPADQSELIKRLWESSVRLAVNCIMAEDQQELDEARAFDWAGWILAKSKTPYEDYEDGDGEED